MKMSLRGNGRDTYSSFLPLLQGSVVADDDVEMLPCSLSRGHETASVCLFVSKITGKHQEGF